MSKKSPNCQSPIIYLDKEKYCPICLFDINKIEQTNADDSIKSGEKNEKVEDTLLDVKIEQEQQKSTNGSGGCVVLFGLIVLVPILLMVWSHMNGWGQTLLRALLWLILSRQLLSSFKVDFPQQACLKILTSRMDGVRPCLEH
jgi:hypothetical protein